MKRDRTRTVGILVFDEVEVLDFAGPFEVFAVTRRAGDDANAAAPLNVVLIAEALTTIRCRNGLQVVPNFALNEHPAIDILLVPGGFGSRLAMKNPKLMSWVTAQASTVELTTSVCTGAFLLAGNGLLDGKSATTHWTSVAWLRKNYPAVDVQENVRFVDQGTIITSAGVSAGIDMALHVVARLYGQPVAAQTARHIEYDPGISRDRL